MTELELAAMVFADSFKLSELYLPEDFKTAFVESFEAGAQWQSKQSPWISVEERLPETDDDLYIALDTKMNPPGCDVCEFNPQTKTWTDSHLVIVSPTHWMKIPK